MMIEQRNLLLEDEMALLLYIVNVVAPIHPPDEIDESILLSIRPEILIARVEKVKPSIKEQYQSVAENLLAKLRWNWIQQVIQNEHTKNTKFNEPDFSI
jgi:hypothetical protein